MKRISPGYEPLDRVCSCYGHLLSRFRALCLEHTAIDIGRPEQTNRWANALPYSLISDHRLSCTELRILKIG